MSTNTIFFINVPVNKIKDDVLLLVIFNSATNAAAIGDI